MLTNKSSLSNIKKYSWLVMLPLIMGLFLSSCGDTPVTSETSFTDSSDVNNNITFVPDQFDAVGTIQGTVIDKATGKALSDVAISLNFSPDGGEPSVVTDTSGSEGTFAFTGVPVNTDQDYEGNSTEDNNSPYTLKISAEELDNYRDLYRYNAAITFESTGGDGAATGLVSDVTIPLSEQAVTLMGKAHTSNDAVLGDVKVKLYQENFNPIINGNSMTQTDMLVDSTTTGNDGSFEFTGVEEEAEVMLKFVDDSDPAEVISHEYYVGGELPSADGSATPKKDLGVINVSSEDRAGAFYVKNVTPAPSADVDTSKVITYVFNRPVADNPYTQTDQGFGSGTFKDDIAFTDDGKKKAPGDIEFSVSFGETRDTLMIDPGVGIEDASEYTLYMSGAFNNDKFVDQYDNMVSHSASDYTQDEVETYEFSTNVNSSKPHTPSITIENDAADPDFGYLQTNWDVNNGDAEVKEYEVWASTNGDAYRHLQTVSADNPANGKIHFNFRGGLNPDNNQFFPFFSTPTYQLALTDELQDPIDEVITHKIKVRAISENLVEGDFSDPVTLNDEEAPEIDFNDADRPGGTGTVVYIDVDEPLSESTAENTDSYDILDGSNNSVNATIEDVTFEFEGYGNGDYDIRLEVANASSLDNGTQVEIDAAVQDLAGNGFNTNDNTAAY